MPSSSRSSTRLPPCRLEWRPQPAVSAALLLLGLLAMLSLVLSDLPRPWLNRAVCLPGLLAVLQALRWQRQPSRHFIFDRSNGRACIDGQWQQRLRISQRCGLLVLHWRRPTGRGWQQCVLLPAWVPGPVLSELRQWPQSVSPFHKRGRSGTIA